MIIWKGQRSSHDEGKRCPMKCSKIYNKPINEKKMLLVAIREVSNVGDIWVESRDSIVDILVHM